MTRILVVAGSRVLSDRSAAETWAKRAIASACARLEVECVAHGNASGPDTWADDHAAWLGVPRVVFALLSSGRPVVMLGPRARPIQRAEHYAYDHRDPLARNAALMRWAADRAAKGHVVEVLGLVAPWATTRGTDHALRCARDLELPVTRIEAPIDSGADPDERTAP